MKQRKRFFLIFILSLLFSATALGVVLYSFGWRFDWNSKRIVKTGIFYFKVEPKSAKVYIDEKFVKKTDIFFGSALISNLLPKKYKVEIKKEGYYPWTKELKIREREATEAKSITLIPKKISFSLLDKNIEKIFISPDGEKILFKELKISQEKKNNESNDIVKKDWTLKLFDIKKNLKIELAEKKDFLFYPKKDFLFYPKKIKQREKKTQFNLDSVVFSKKAKKAVLKIKTEKEARYFLLNLEENFKKPILLDFLKNENIKDIYFNPANNEKLFISVKESAVKSKTSKKEKESAKKSPEELVLKEVDLKNKKITPLGIKNIISFSVDKNKIFYLANDGFLYEKDMFLQKNRKITLLPLPLDKNTSCAINSLNSEFILNCKEGIYLVEEKGTFRKIKEENYSIVFSPDFKKAGIFDKHNIFILFLKEKYSQPQREKGELAFLTRFNEEIKNLYWYNGNYLIFSVGKKIKITEIDNRDHLNIYSLGEFKDPEIFWSPKESILFVLSENLLYSSGKLLP